MNMSPITATPTRIEALTHGVDRVEHGIRPAVFSAVTLPLRVDDKDVGISVYVIQSAFASHYVSQEEMQAIAAEVARRINHV